MTGSVAMGVPIIDIGSKPRDLTRELAIARTIADASAEWGFFQVVNHGVPEELIATLWQQTRRFFDQPVNAKRALVRTRENPRGYYDRELTKNQRDLKEVFDFGVVPHPDLADDDPRNLDPVNGSNRWPEDLPGFRETMLRYLQACEGIAQRLTRLFCLGLGADAHRLDAAFRPCHTGFIRLNYYPLTDPLGTEDTEAAAPLGDMALHHHTDAGALTVLLQDEVGGLQVYAHDTWWDVEPLDGALVVNTADMMQVWSNDRYRAALHRVRPVTNRARYSVPFFYNPAYECDCAPLPELTAHAPAVYRPINWGEFRALRTDGDYADYGEEVQLHHYRTA